MTLEMTVRLARRETHHPDIRMSTSSVDAQGDSRRQCLMCGGPARLYTIGWRCDEHSPAALRDATIPIPPAQPPKCSECGGRLTIVESGQTTHPGCNR